MVTIRTVHAKDPLRELAAQACDDAQVQVNKWAREVATAQETIANLTAENDFLTEELHQAIYERDEARNG